jgi:hypothetical protein
MAVTPVIKERGRGGSVTAVSPKSNIFNTSSRDRGKILVEPVEGHGIPSLPNGPSDGCVDSSLLIGAAVREPKVFEGGRGHVIEVVVKMTPDLLGVGAQQKKVVRIFIKRAGAGVFLAGRDHR